MYSSVSNIVYFAIVHKIIYLGYPKNVSSLLDFLSRVARSHNIYSWFITNNYSDKNFTVETKEIDDDDSNESIDIC